MPVDLLKLPTIPTWAPKFSQENLKSIEGTREFQRGFRQQAYTAGELMFPSFPTCFNEGLLVSEVIQRKYPTYIGVDLSSPYREGNVIVALQLDPGNSMRYPVHIRCGNWTSPETADNLADVCSMFEWIEFIMVENNAYQQSIIDWVKVGRSFPHWNRVEAMTTGRQKFDPNFGLPGLEIEFKNKSWAVPSGEWAGHETGHGCGWCRWRREINTYPRGAKTDCVMATWFAITAINLWGRRVMQRSGKTGFAGLTDR